MKTSEETKEFKGTKEKWFAARDANGLGVFTEREKICTLYEHRHSGEEVDANARLIAAAPEILKELIDFCKTFESTIGYQGYDHNVFVALNDRYIKSKKAIKKALGL